MVVDVMSKKNPPTNPADLIDICVKDWKPQSVSRKHRVRAIKQFLDHAVTREGIADIWTPPTDQVLILVRLKRERYKYKKLVLLRVIFRY